MTDPTLVGADQGPSDSPLVSVSFQKNEKTKFKYLEGEPKALGITQICLSIFHISCVGSLFVTGLTRTGLEIPSIISSLLIFIAGSLAIAATNLHVPTLRACLGMEVIATIASVFNLVSDLVKMNDFWYMSCYYSMETEQWRQACRSITGAHTRMFSELVIIQVILSAISISLLVYAAKVANCCASTPKVPVITIQAPPAPQ